LARPTLDGGWQPVLRRLVIGIARPDFSSKPFENFSPFDRARGTRAFFIGENLRRTKSNRKESAKSARQNGRTAGELTASGRPLIRLAPEGVGGRHDTQRGMENDGKWRPRVAQHGIEKAALLASTSLFWIKNNPVRCQPSI
jgi:hypothetical protein